MCQGPRGASADVEKNITPELQALCTCGVTYSYSYKEGRYRDWKKSTENKFGNRYV